MLNRSVISGKLQFLKFRIRDFMLNNTLYENVAIT